MRRKLSFLSGLLTNIFLAALIIAMYHATQPGGVLPVSAPQYRGSGERAALPFAVSWNAAAIPDILDILKDKSVRTTFAVSGEWAENNPALLMRMAAEGGKEDMRRRACDILRRLAQYRNVYAGSKKTEINSGILDDRPADGQGHCRGHTFPPA